MIISHKRLKKFGCLCLIFGGIGTERISFLKKRVNIINKMKKKNEKINKMKKKKK